jgi:hypothetical protein
MSITLSPICGVQFGIELTEGVINEKKIGYLLIDLFILRVQCAWFQE